MLEHVEDKNVEALLEVQLLFREAWVYTIMIVIEIYVYMRFLNSGIARSP